LSIGYKSHRRIYFEALKNLQEYYKWNRTLADYCLLVGGGGEQVCLSISPSILAAAWSQHQACDLSTETAEANFIEAVSSVYSVIVPSKGLRSLEVLGKDGLPRSIAFLGLSVLAAYNMHRDDEHAANSYYSRLSDLLGCGSDGEYPRGFNPSEFKHLWGHLRGWLKGEKGISLAFPARNSGVGHIINIPLSHVPLRQIDLRKLPSFFSSHGYNPGSITSRHKLERDFMRWAGLSRLTHSGLAALNDERLSAVMLQVAQELEAWDGVIDDAAGTSASVELQMDFVRHRPQLYYLPRRPRGFPELFEAGHCTFESCEEGWYDPVPVPPEDGGVLAEGFAWTITCKARTLSLRRSGSHAIALAPAPFQAGYVSRQRLLLNVRGAALCREHLADEAAAYLKRITGNHCSPEKSQGLPIGWVLFRDIVPLKSLANLSPQLYPLDVEVETNILPVGGLRISRRQWITGAPPRIYISGYRSNTAPTIDGEEVTVNAEGQLIDEGRLAERGTHLITAGRESLRIGIVEPHVPPPDRIDDYKYFSKGTLTALPFGRWTLIGASCHEIMHVVSQLGAGVIARTPFKAVWAINCSQMVGTKIVCLDSTVPHPTQPAAFSNMVQRQIAEQWALAVLSSSATHVRIGCFTEASETRARNAWRAYVSAACSITNSLRMARRGRA
jgi:hypothetical protein